MNLLVKASGWFFLAAMGASARGADHALVVGVEEYKPLVAASTLKGCANDAAGMAQALKDEGFDVTFIINDEATKQGIFDKIEAIKKVSTKSDRFVFYFAGHGRSAPRYALMPSDATFDGNDISPKELNDAIIAVPARSRTVLLDSCFSGGMAAGEMSRGLDDFKARYFDDSQARSVKFGVPPKPTSQKDSTKPLEQNTGICYYTAALSSEQALEATMPDGKRHGLFTYAVINSIKEGKLWGDVHNDVKTIMSKRLEHSGRTQNPMISTQFVGSPAFDPISARPKLIPTKTLLQVWNEDNPSPDKIALKMKPDQDVIETGRHLGLDVVLGDDGYLIIFGQVGDHFYQFFPAGSVLAKDALVKKGVFSFPGPKDILFFDDFGADHLKAMLFHTKDAAQLVLDGFQSTGGKSPDAKLAHSVSETPFTSRLSVAVSDSLLGGSRLKDLDGLYRDLLGQGDAKTKFLYGKLNEVAGGYDKGGAWLSSVDAKKAPTVEDRQTFMTLLNLAIQNALLYDEAAFKGVRLNKGLKKRLSSNPTGEDLWSVNRAVLLAAFPKEVNPDDAGR